MSEFFEQTSRDPEQDFKDMSELLNQRGWVIVNGVVRSISVGLGIYFQIEPGIVSVFNPTAEAKRWLPKYPGMASDTNFQMPHVMLAHKTFRYGLSQIAGGTITGITGFRLVENS